MLPKPALRPGGTGAIIGIFALLSLVPVVALGIGPGDVINSGVQQQNLEEAERSVTVPVLTYHRVAPLSAVGGVLPILLSVILAFRHGFGAEGEAESGETGAESETGQQASAATRPELTASPSAA